MSSGGFPASWPARKRLTSVLARRIREPAFWRIQAMVLLATTLHIAFESDSLPIEFVQRIPPGFHQIPVALYVVPVTYGGFIYGFEGGVLTGLWCALLASVNIPLSHQHEFEWLAEIVFILVVVGMGIVMSIPVERERQQREQAEATTRQVRMLNDVIQTSLQPWGLEHSTRSALHELARILDTQGACLALWKRDRDELVISVSHATDDSFASELEAKALQAHGGNGTGPVFDRDLLCVPLGTEGLNGVLCVGLKPGQTLSKGHQRFLKAVGGQLVMGIDNNLLREQERELLESYVRLVTEAQEEERRSIARELHDRAVQQLAVLTRGLDEIADSQSTGKRELERLRGLAESTLGELRQFSRDLRPALLDDLGLVPALQWLVNDVAARTGTEAELAVHGDSRRLLPELEIALYRITQEALRNVERHADSNHVMVTASFESKRVLVSIEDDGTGFDVPANLNTLVTDGKLGLIGMQERAQLVGGKLTVLSNPHNGTVLSAEIPS